MLRFRANGVTTLHRVPAIIFAIEEISKDSNLPPNVTFISDLRFYRPKLKLYANLRENHFVFVNGRWIVENLPCRLTPAITLTETTLLDTSAGL